MKKHRKLFILFLCVGFLIIVVLLVRLHQIKSEVYESMHQMMDKIVVDVKKDMPYEIIPGITAVDIKRENDCFAVYYSATAEVFAKLKASQNNIKGNLLYKGPILDSKELPYRELMSMKYIYEDTQTKEKIEVTIHSSEKK